MVNRIDLTGALRNGKTGVNSGANRLWNEDRKICSMKAANRSKSKRTAVAQRDRGYNGQRREITISSETERSRARSKNVGLDLYSLVAVAE